MDERTQGSKLVNILCIVGIIAFFVLVIVFVINTRSKKNNTNTTTQIYEPFETTTANKIEQTTAGGEYQTAEEVLSLIEEDVISILCSNNVNFVITKAPGTTLGTYGNIRDTFGKSTAFLMDIWYADYDLSTETPIGQYLMEFTVNTDTDSKKLYVYVTLSSFGGKFSVSSIFSRIGDF